MLVLCIEEEQPIPLWCMGTNAAMQFRRIPGLPAEVWQALPSDLQQQLKHGDNTIFHY